MLFHTGRRAPFFGGRSSVAEPESSRLEQRAGRRHKRAPTRPHHGLASRKRHYDDANEKALRPTSTPPRLVKPNAAQQHCKCKGTTPELDAATVCQNECDPKAMKIANNGAPIRRHRDLSKRTRPYTSANETKRDLMSKRTRP